ncbi:TetR family transcriptional regulator [Streptomyces sp. NPDC058622]|uniref:TetR family transcriptional regulator n=1 Tax=Streptomyces sp. NPDC058622 TaxID=3346562 RepID=UPI003661ADB6
MAKQERAARTRESLVRAAAEVFAEQGFVTASIAVISRRAGVSAGGLHFHFESKTALAQAVEDRAAEALWQITAGRQAFTRMPGTPVEPGELSAPGTPGELSAPGTAGEPRVPGVAGEPRVPGVAGVAGVPGAAAEPELPGAPGASGVAGVPGSPGVMGGRGVEGVSGAAGAAGAAGVAGGGGGGGAGRCGGSAGPNSLQVLVDSTHALMALLAGDVVVRAGYGLCADASRRSGVDLRRQWTLWVQEAVGAAAREGALAEGVCARDAASAVVASTVGLEVLGAGERDWVAPHTLTRFWALMLPRLAAAGTLDALLPQGSAAGPAEGGPRHPEPV